MDINKMNTRELMAFLRTKDVSREICDLMEEHAIDGSTLLYLTKDIEEFTAVLPKSGHRLKVKKVISKLEEEASKYDSPKQDEGEEKLVATKDRNDDIELVEECIDMTVVDQPLTPATSDIAEVPEDVPIVTSESKMAVTPVTVGKSKEFLQSSGLASSRKRKDVNSPLPDPLPFPNNFSLVVEGEITKGSVLPVRRQLIADVGCFYLGITSHPQQGDYKRIALLICKKFPELRDSNPSTYWLSLQKQLSQFFRNARRKTTTKPDSVGLGKSSESQASTSKRAKLFKDDPEAQKRNLQLLRDAKPGAMAKKTYASLIEDTFNERRNFVKNVAESSAEILNMCPYLGKQENVRKEMCRIIKEDMGKAEKRLLNALRYVLGKDDKLTAEDVLGGILIVEKKIGKKKPNNLIRFKDPSAKVDNLFRDSIIEFRVLCIGCPEDIQQIFITGENQVFIESRDQDLVKALVDLLSAYYVFDVSYPAGMLGSLSFLEEICLESTDIAYKGTKYTTFMTELKSKMS